MKKTLLSSIALLLSIIAFAQNGINYKAQIKDGVGEIVANQSITIQFTIQRSNGSGVYRESHSPTTNEDGIIILNIGEGTPLFSSFSSINWQGIEYFLNVQVDTGDGLVNLGTTPFKSVPYAKYAEEAGNVNGLVAIDEGNGIGYRLANQDPSFYGTIGESAIDFTINTGASNYGATGAHAIAGGVNSKAEGEYSVAFGSSATSSGSNAFAMGLLSVASGSRSVAFGGGEASGLGSFAMGSSSQAIGNLSTAIGIGSEAIQDVATAIGYQVVAPSTGEMAVGLYNTTYSPGAPSGLFSSSDRVFSVGNGWDGIRSNALSIYKNGIILAESLDIAEITNNKALITKEYFEFVETKGLEQITEGGNTGFRLVDKNPLQYGNIGNNAVDLSTSIGSDTNHGATGDRSLAVGASTIASGGNSIAMGFESEASGGNAFAMGYRTKAEANSCLAIGSYNIGGGNPVNFTSTNPIFEIGNGTSPNGRRNALTVLQNGSVGIGIHTGMEGKVEIQSNSTATAPQLALIEDNAGFARLKFKNINRNGDDYWDIAGFIGTTTADDRLNFFNSDGGNIMSLTGDGDVFVNGSLVHSSDRRLKREIETIDYGLAEILQLNPVQYNWQNKEDKTHKSLGVIAQEIQEIIPNVVQTSTDKNQTLSVSYTELIPVLIKAIQEQQKIIDSQQTQISTQDKRFSQLEAQLMNLIEGLENTNTSK